MLLEDLVGKQLELLLQIAAGFAEKGFLVPEAPFGLVESRTDLGHFDLGCFGVGATDRAFVPSEAQLLGQLGVGTAETNGLRAGHVMLGRELSQFFSCARQFLLGAQGGSLLDVESALRGGSCRRQPFRVAGPAPHRASAVLSGGATKTATRPPRSSPKGPNTMPSSWRCSFCSEAARSAPSGRPFEVGRSLLKKGVNRLLVLRRRVGLGQRLHFALLH